MVDYSGEFRLWDISLGDQSGDQSFAPTLQVFMIRDHTNIAANICFVELPFNPSYSKDSYSNIIAASCKMIHFCPEKNSKE